MKVYRFISSINFAFFSSVTFFYSVTLLLVCVSITPYLPHAKAAGFNSQQNYVNSKAEKLVKIKKVISGTPVFISIPKLNLNKEVLPGVYDAATKTWSITPSGVHYAQLSSKINDSEGNTLLYAHNSVTAFAFLYILKNGDSVSVKTDTGYRFNYVLKSADDFDPNDTDIFSYSGPPKLTLQTCSGMFNEYRRLYSFKLASVEKI